MADKTKNDDIKQDTSWDLDTMTPQALASAPAPTPGSRPRCPDGCHSSGWYVGYACTRCGDID